MNPRKLVLALVAILAISCDSSEQYRVRTYVKASNPEANDLYGNDIAVSGRIFVVGAPWESGSGRGINPPQTDNGTWASGAAYVYRYGASGPAFVAYLKAPQSSGGITFGWSVTAFGDLFAVAAPAETVNGLVGAGAVHVYRYRDNPSRVEYVTRVTAPVPRLDARFGTSIALYGTRLVAGAPRETRTVFVPDPTGGFEYEVDRVGAAYVFALNGNGPVLEAELHASGAPPTIGTGFGEAVDVSGERVAVVGPFSEFEATFLFARGPDGAWVRDGSFPGATGAFALDGSRLLLADPERTVTSNGQPIPRAGAVDVFRRTATTWVFEQTLTALVPRNEGFGGNVDLFGALLVIGAAGNGADFEDPRGRNEDNANIPGSGAVYVFERTGSAQAPWTIRYRLKAPVIEAGDGFGTNVSLWNDVIAASAPGEDSNATRVNGNQNDNSRRDSGAAYIVVREPAVPTPPPSNPDRDPVPTGCPSGQICCWENADGSCGECVSRGNACR